MNEDTAAAQKPPKQITKGRKLKGYKCGYLRLFSICPEFLGVKLFLFLFCFCILKNVTLFYPFLPFLLPPPPPALLHLLADDPI